MIPRWACFFGGVSIHAPREGERRVVSPGWYGSVVFQSTLPARGSDGAVLRRWRGQQCFNPRSPRGGATLVSPRSVITTRCFNPRSPRGGATCSSPCRPCTGRRFNPRSPRGGATVYGEDGQGYVTVSIHAPREGERRGGIREIVGGATVSIHAPREGERLGRPIAFHRAFVFQSTLPARGSDMQSQK